MQHAWKLDRHVACHPVCITSNHHFRGHKDARSRSLALARARTRSHALALTSPPGCSQARMAAHKRAWLRCAARDDHRSGDPTRRRDRQGRAAGTKARPRPARKPGPGPHERARTRTSSEVEPSRAKNKSMLFASRAACAAARTHVPSSMRRRVAPPCQVAPPATCPGAHRASAAAY
jgi:hypothetical protein